jgi:transposase
MDLRTRIVEARERGDETLEELAERFGVGRASVVRLTRRYRERGEVEPDQLGGVRKRLIEDDKLDDVHIVVEEQPDRTLPELARAFEKRTGILVSRQTMGRAVRRAGLTRKKRPSAPSSRRGRT